MRWGTVEIDGVKSAGILVNNRVVTLRDVNQKFGTQFPVELEEVIGGGHAASFVKALDAHPEWVGELGRQEATVRVLAPLQRPERIVGIGLNYADHAHDLSESVPDEPATFMKPTTSIVGLDDTIKIPQVSHRSTAEAEVALVFSKECKDVPPEQWQSVIFGMVPVLDMTAEDILRRNPRFLTRAKGFDSFFSLGPWIVTPDEWPSSLDQIEVRTLVQGHVVARNVLANMSYGLADLVAFVTRGCTVGPSAVLTTGTPGAAVLAEGMQITAEVEGIGRLSNWVGVS